MPRNHQCGRRKTPRHTSVYPSPRVPNAAQRQLAALSGRNQRLERKTSPWSPVRSSASERKLRPMRSRPRPPRRSSCYGKRTPNCVAPSRSTARSWPPFSERRLRSLRVAGRLIRHPRARPGSTPTFWHNCPLLTQQAPAPTLPPREAKLAGGHVGTSTRRSRRVESQEAPSASLRANGGHGRRPVVEGSAGQAAPGGLPQMIGGMAPSALAASPGSQLQIKHACRTADRANSSASS